jgi:hypothetical protein
MKQTLKFWSLATLVALCVGFSSCSEDDEGGGSIVGLWTYASFTLDCKNPTYPDLEEYEKQMAVLASAFLSGVTIEFKSDGTFVFNNPFDENIVGSWSANGSNYILSVNGGSIETGTPVSDGASISIVGNVLTMTQNYLDEEYDEDTHQTYSQAGFTKYTQKLIFKK